MSKVKRVAGFTLIELMLAILLGLLMIGVIVAIYMNSITSSADTVKSAQLNHDLSTATLLMTNDIRRAGYWGGAVTGVDARTNPFTQGTANIQIPSSDCILYSYDGGSQPGDADDSNGVVNTSEHYGFKLSGGTIQMKVSGNTNADCDDGTWSDLLNSAEIDVTSLIFSFVQTAQIPGVNATSHCLNSSIGENVAKDCASAISDGDFTTSSGEIVETRQVLYRVVGTLDDDTTVTKTVTGSVRVQNDRLFTQP